MKKAIFATTNFKQGSTAASTTRCGFFVAFPNSSDTRKSVIASVNGSQSVLPLFGIGHGMHMALFLFSAYHEGKFIYKRIKRPNKAMRNTQPITLDSIRDRVSNVHNLLETKRTLNEVFMTYFVSNYFADANEDYRNDATYLAILLTEILTVWTERGRAFIHSLFNPRLSFSMVNRAMAIA